MDAMNDLDRELARALQVDPAADFAARVRARIAEEPGPSRWHVPALALSAIGGAVVAVLGASLWLQAPGRRMPGEIGVLPHQSRVVLAPFVTSPRTESPQPPASAPTTAAAATTDLMVSRSEMLALQRLFSGATVAPPAPPVVDELSIPELAFEPIPIVTIPEGDRQ
jgi:hypothetical protein